MRRVLERFDGAARAPAALAERARALIPAGRAAAFNQAMMELGATVCRPRAPLCPACPVRAGCAAHAAGGPPAPPPRRRGAARFEDTDRWARGRIVAALLAGEPPPRRDHGRAARARAGRARARRPDRARCRRRRSAALTILTRVDRDAIERRDFPVGRRGYDQAAVDDHLRRVADELDALKSRPAAPAAASPLSAGTSEQVRLILEAAETSAAELRADAGRQAGDHVGRVRAGRRRDAHPPRRARARAARRCSTRSAAAASGSTKGSRGCTSRSATSPAGPRSRRRRGAARGRGAPPAVEEPPAAEPPSQDGDEAGARLIALNMALSGTPREETARYLAEHFSLADPDALLDDVYDRAGQ